MTMILCPDAVAHFRKVTVQYDPVLWQAAGHKMGTTELTLNPPSPFLSVFQIPVGQFEGSRIVRRIAILAGLVGRAVLLDNAQGEEA